MFNVCMLTYAMPPEHSGAAIQAIRLATQLRLKGVGIFFITQGNKAENLRSNNVSDFRVIRIYKETLFWKLLAPFRFFTALIRELRNFDIIHVHGVGYISKIAVVFGLLFGKKVIVKMTMFGEDDPMSIKHAACGAVNFAFFSLASHYIALTKSFYQSCSDAGIPAAKISLIPNGVDTDKFCPVSSQQKADLRRKLGIPPGKKVLVYAGIMRPEKGVDFLLDVISLAFAKRDDLILLLLGPVESWLSAGEKLKVEETLRRIKAQQDNGSVIYRGRVENVNEYFQASDIFVSASLREGLQNVLIEAMACALPPVAVEIPDMHRNIIVNGVEGFIVEERQLELFLERIFQLVDDEDMARRMSQSAWKKVSESYSLPKITLCYLQLYQDILGVKSSVFAGR